MLKMSKTHLCVAVSVLAFAVSIAPARAEDNAATLQALQDQINALQKQLAQVQAAQAQEAKAKPAAAPSGSAAATGAADGTVGGGVKLKVGGFIEAAGIERSKNETTDVASNFNTSIPFNNSVNAHQSEFRGTARQSRITLLATAKADDATDLAAYVESDFLGAAPTANSTESNSYNPRVRVAYASVDQNDWGLHFLAGQEWSLLTTNKVGINPRQENIPLTIDAQYVPGFNWTRNPQVRVVKDFDDHKLAIGLSAESPQASLGGQTVPGTINVTNTGTSPLSSAAYSTDFAPDVILKAAYDPGWGHYEVFGIARFFHDNVLATNHNNSYLGGGGGAAAILPVIPKKLDLQANIMAGEGIGRYGSVQLPDFTFTAGGGLKMLTEYTELVGLVAHPAPTWDTYIYAGEEGVRRANQTSAGFGYGDFNVSNAACNNTAGGTCNAVTSNVWQVTGGFWDRIYEGNYGKVQVGLQDSLTRRNAFSDAAGNEPHSYENIVMTSFRFYPQ